MFGTTDLLRALSIPDSEAQDSLHSIVLNQWSMHLRVADVSVLREREGLTVVLTFFMIAWLLWSSNFSLDVNRVEESRVGVCPRPGRIRLGLARDFCL